MRDPDATHRHYSYSDVLEGCPILDMSGSWKTLVVYRHITLQLGEPTYNRGLCALMLRSALATLHIRIGTINTRLKRWLRSMSTPSSSLALACARFITVIFECIIVGRPGCAFPHPH